MGLDMYLTGKLYTSNYTNSEVNEKLAVVTKELGLPGCDNLGTIVLDIECAYWRKANAIHKWFVSHVQNNEDDCGTYSASVSQLCDLVSECREALEHRDPSILPTSGGFFFGSTDIDDWYWKMLEATIKQVVPLIEFSQKSEDANTCGMSYYYHSHW